VSWHQDSAYYGLDPHEEVTAWVALTPSAVANGCLRVLPGSHLLADYRHEETYDPQNLLARGQTIAGIDESRAVDLELRAGQFSLHQERTAHASAPNPSDRRRVGVAFFYMPAHTRSTMGRRGAMLVRGEDRHGHWDRDPEPRMDLDPVCLDYLDRMWAGYRDSGVQQAAERGLV
jgi:non-heme Fe2+,alpha-ketoglutarate-dependent halogenase